MYIPNFNFLAQWKGDRGGTALFKVKKGEIPISSPLINLASWFFDKLYNFQFSIDWLEKERILRFGHSAPTFAKLRYSWIFKYVRMFSKILLFSRASYWKFYYMWKKFKLPSMIVVQIHQIICRLKNVLQGGSSFGKLATSRAE